MADTYYCAMDCDDLPCRGHRVTQQIRLAADVLAWADGWDDIAESDQQDEYWASAAQALAEIRGKR